MRYIEILRDDIVMQGAAILPNDNIDVVWQEWRQRAVNGGYEEISITDHVRDCECADEMGMDDACRVIRAESLAAS